MNSIWVEILPHDRETSWTYENIGCTVEVAEFDKDYYKLIEDDPERGVTKLIRKKDTKLIE